MRVDRRLNAPQAVLILAAAAAAAGIVAARPAVAGAVPGGGLERLRAFLLGLRPAVFVGAATRLAEEAACVRVTILQTV